ncbi:MAG: glycerophosphodiester phosphodiesterase [Bacteroidetes bacterium]|nr:glycerophosphodiester phosphodiesterase [Bacteroidota bacterium]
MRIFLALFLVSRVSAFSQPFDLQGHRGCRGLMPENTIPAFVEALKHGVTTLELDVVVSKDGQLVVSHEPWVSGAICENKKKEAIVGMQHNIYQLTYAEVLSFDCGSKFNKKYPEQKKVSTVKPLLIQVLDTVEALIRSGKCKSVNYNIEIKQSPGWENLFTPPTDVFVKKVVDVLSENNIKNRTTLQSFDIGTLEAIHKMDPEIKTAFLVLNKNSLKKNLHTLSFKPTIYSPYYRLVRRKTVKHAHAQGIQVIPWTVNKKSKMKKLIRFKVDGIITDYPNRLNEVVNKS